MNSKTVLIVGAVAAGGVLAYLLYKKGGTILSTTLNPASDQNAAYTGTNSALQAAGVIDDDETLGTAIYDWTHTDYDPNVPGSGETLTASKWLSGIWAAPANVVASIANLFVTAPAATQPASSTPYDYGQGGAAGVPWALDTSTSTEPAPWWTGGL